MIFYLTKKNTTSQKKNKTNGKNVTSPLKWLIHLANLGLI